MIKYFINHTNSLFLFTFNFLVSGQKFYNVWFKSKYVLLVKEAKSISKCLPSENTRDNVELEVEVLGNNTYIFFRVNGLLFDVYVSVCCRRGLSRVVTLLKPGQIFTV